METEVTLCCLSSSVRRVRHVDQVNLSCSVMTFQGCSFQLTWLFNKVPVVESGSLKISTSSCKATVETLTSHYYDQSSEKFLTCEIQNNLDQTVQWFSFGASGGKHSQRSEEAQDLDCSSVPQVRLQQQQQQLCHPEETRRHSEVDVSSRCSFGTSHHCCCSYLGYNNPASNTTTCNQPSFSQTQIFSGVFSQISGGFLSSLLQRLWQF